MAFPYVVSVGAVANNTTAITAVLPEGWIQDDLLFIVVSTANQALTTPSGYTLASNLPAGIGTAATAGGVRLFVFWKRATASEADVAIADSGNYQAAQMFAVRGAITTGDPFDASASAQQTTATTTVTYPTVTTTVDDALVLMFVGLDQDVASTANLGVPTNANLDWIVECIDRTIVSGVGGGMGVVMGGKATAGAVGTTSGTLTSQVCVTYTAAIKPAATQAAPNYFFSGAGTGGSAGITVAIPAAYNAGDIFVMFCHTANQDLPTSPPTGWTAVSNPASGTGTAGAIGGIKLHVFWRRATASESDVTLGDSGDYTAARILSFKGCVETGDPWDVTATSLQSTASTALSFPSVTTSEDNCYIVMAVAGDFDPAANTQDTMFSGAYTPGSGIVGLDKLFDAGFATATGGIYGVFGAIKKTAGATGTTSATLTDSQVFTTWIGALKPVSTGTTYQQACYATATGSVSIARLNTFLIVASAAASGSVSLTKMISKLFSVSGTATPSLTRMVSMTFAVTASGAVSAAQTLVTFIAVQCLATGSGTVSLAKRITKVLTTSGTGAVTYADLATYLRAFAVTGTGTASVSKLIRKTLSVTSSATVGLTKRISKTLTVSASAGVSAARGFLLTQSSTSAGTGTASSTQTFILKGTTAEYVRLLIRNTTRNLVRLIRRY